LIFSIIYLLKVNNYTFLCLFFTPCKAGFCDCAAELINNNFNYNILLLFKEKKKEKKNINYSLFLLFIIIIITIIIIKINYYLIFYINKY